MTARTVYLAARDDPRSSSSSRSATFFLAADEPRSDDDSKLIRSLLDAHNRERAEAKLLLWSSSTQAWPRAAQAHSNDMAAHRKMTHDGSDGSTPSDRIKRQNYPFMSDGENVAEGYRTVDSLMRGWMESEHHRENILGNYTQVGFGVARNDEGDPYWTSRGTPPPPGKNSTRPERPTTRSRRSAMARSDAGFRSPRTPQHPQLSKSCRRGRQDVRRGGYPRPGRNRVTRLDAILDRLGYRYQRFGESVAMGQQTAIEVLKTWMDSKAHRVRLLDNFTEIGVGYASSKTVKPYWCLILARPQTH